jgi:hypothetical protein
LRVGGGGIRVRGCDDGFGEGEDRERGCRSCESGHCVILCNDRSLQVLGKLWGRGVGYRGVEEAG